MPVCPGCRRYAHCASWLLTGAASAAICPRAATHGARAWRRWTDLNRLREWVRVLDTQEGHHSFAQLPLNHLHVRQCSWVWIVDQSYTGFKFCSHQRNDML